MSLIRDTDLQMNDSWNKSLSLGGDQDLEVIKKQALRRGAAKPWWEKHPSSPRFLVSWSAWPLPQWAESSSVPAILCERVPVEEHVAFLRPHTLRTEQDVWASRARGYQGVRLCVQPTGASLQYLIEVCRELGMVPIVQVASKEDVRLALETDADVVECLSGSLLSLLQDFEWEIICGFCHSVEEVRKALQKGEFWFSIADHLWQQLIQPQGWSREE